MTHHCPRPADALLAPPPDALVEGEPVLPRAVPGRAQIAHQVKQLALRVGVQAPSVQGLLTVCQVLKAHSVCVAESGREPYENRVL